MPGTRLWEETRGLRNNGLQLQPCAYGVDLCPGRTVSLYVLNHKHTHTHTCSVYIYTHTHTYKTCACSGVYVSGVYLCVYISYVCVFVCVSVPTPTQVHRPGREFCVGQISSAMYWRSREENLDYLIRLLPNLHLQPWTKP